MATRRKAARKRKSVGTTLRLTPLQADMLRELAALDDVATRSEIVRRLIVEEWTRKKVTA